MGFVLCKNPGTRNCLPQTRISKNGSLTLSRTTTQKYRFEDYKYMKLFWDKDKGLIGIELCNKNDIGIIKITKTHVYSLRGFFRYFEVDHKDFIGLFNVFKEEDHAFIMIDLNTKQ